MEPRSDWVVPRPEPPPVYEREPHDIRPPTGPRRQSRLRRTFGPVIAAIVAFAAKFKAIILLLPKIKLLATAGTMFVSLAAYAWIWGWQFAAGFIALLFVHEMGHWLQLRREGIRASGPMFIPFLGAVIMSRSLGRNALAEARVGLAGPIVGSLGAAACILVWHATGNDLWRALAFTGFFLNLLNLLPVLPLDGGRAMAAMAPWMWVVGFVALIPLLIFFPNPIFLLILIFGGYETYKRWKLRRSGGEAQDAYYRVRPLHRALVAAVYLGLIGLLVVAMHATTLTRTFN
jgi:Zn-dependent protease